MRFVGEEGIRADQLARLARTRTNLNGMERWRYVTVDRAGPQRGWTIRATSKGLEARGIWEGLFGDEAVRGLRQALERIRERLWTGLELYPEGWRAKVRKPSVLPQYPMVLHRGGFPDGS